MTDNRLRTSIGLFWVASQLLVFLVLGICRLLGGFEGDDVKDLVEIILPMFSGVGTVIIRYFTKHRHDSDAGETLNFPYVVLAWGLPCTFAILIVAAIVLRALNRMFDDLDELKFVLATLQTVYVGYIAVLLAPLFGATESETLKKPEV